MSLANSMDNFSPKHVPQIWLIHRREHLESHHQTLEDLSERLAHFTGRRDVIAVLEAAESLEKLTEQVQVMEEMFETRHLFSQDYNSCYTYDLSRIKELASSTSQQLQTIARQLSWGLSYDKQVGQVQRNLFPLTRLLNIILKWLEQII